MPIFRTLRNLARNLFLRGRVRREIDEELRGALAALEAEHRAAGLSHAEARRAAAIAFGSIDAIKDRVGDARTGASLETLARDTRFALRLLRRSPLFAVFAIASLALGIGATSAIFFLFDAVVLRKLPVPDPDGLVVASIGRSGGTGGTNNYSLPYPQFEAIAARSRLLDGVFAVNPMGRVNVAIGGQSESAEGLYVSGEYYRTLRLAPAAGRFLAPDDDRGGRAVAVLSYDYWQRRFGGRGDAIGGAVTIDQVPFTIVGVEPAGFSGTEVGRPYDVAVPLRTSASLSEEPPLWNRSAATWIYVMGRLAPGVTLTAAEQETQAIFAEAGLAAARSASDQQFAREAIWRLEPGARGIHSDLRQSYGRWLRLLLTLLGAVLLLASLNVATLLVARTDARQREIATRLALGAGRGRVVRQLVTESLLLALAAGALAFALAVVGSRALLGIAVPSAEIVPVHLAPDARLLVFTFAASIATCLIFGLVPAIRATRGGCLNAVRQVGGAPGRRLLDRVLVASQVALSLVLLVAAGLFLRTLDRLWAQDPGYQRSHVLMFSIEPRLAGRRGDEVPRTYRRVLDAVRGVPAVERVTMSAVRPISRNYYFVTSFRELGAITLPPERRVRVAFNHVAPGYFATLGVPLLAGRDFDDRDAVGAPRVAIISERMARHFSGSPIGQRLGAGSGAREVVGVVGDVRYARVKDQPREVVYMPIFQMAPRDIFYTPTVEIRGAAAATTLLPAVRDAVTHADPAITLFEVKTLEAETDESFAQERLLAILSGYAGAFAVLLAGIGLYGLATYSVLRRTPEIGLRMALGATPSAVRRLIVRESAVTIGAGAAAGLCAAFLAVQLLRSQLFGIEPTDPVALAGAVALLLAIAAAAACIPAVRAARIDPLHALRLDT
ncbi:MAG TPA: ABC transporter permease [Vicinamibacterales bacterium]|nr:ABC transporter permease [Vicinamibacterales bacterium]